MKAKILMREEGRDCLEREGNLLSCRDVQRGARAGEIKWGQDSLPATNPGLHPSRRV